MWQSENCAKCILGIFVRLAGWLAGWLISRERKILLVGWLADFA